MKYDVEYCEYVNSKGVVFKRTANGVDLPLLTDQPTFVVWKPMEWGVRKTMMTQEEWGNRFNPKQL